MTKFHYYLCGQLQKLYESVRDGTDKNVIIEVQPQIGKQLDHNTPVLSTKGWTKHGDLKVGDFVFSPSGKPIQVIGLSPESMGDIEVTFLGGQKVVCHENHEWVVFDHSRHKYRTIEAKELLATPLGGGPRGSTYRFKVDYTKALEMPKVKLPLHPYVLGAWLGDGKSSGVYIAHHAKDMDVVNTIEFLGYQKTNFWIQKITGVAYTEFNGIKSFLKQIKVFKNKHIPDQYLWADIESRRDLLRGLMDTDGTVDASRGYNRYYFSNTNKVLIDSVVFLVESLGYRASVSRIEPCLSSSGIQGIKPVYNLSFSIHDDFIPFRLKRKAIKCIYKSIRRRRAIISVKRVTPRPGRCIQVDSPDGLYLVTEHLIPTHNSRTASELFPAWVLGKESWPIICASYGASLAEVKSSNCRDVVSSEQYQMIFPETKLHPETAAKDYWKTTIGGSYRAAGVGGGLTGQPGKIMIADDLFKDAAEAGSETVRANTLRWWQTVFWSRRQDVSGVALVNTRWHKEDIAGVLEAQYEVDSASDKKPFEYDHWQTLSFPAFALEDEYIDGELFRKEGEVLCPERFSFETMVRRRNAMEVYEWSSLYMQRPILKENAKFRREHFRYYKPEDIKTKDLSWYILVDPASSKRAGADNTVVRAVGKERSSGFWFLGDEIAGHLDPGQTVDSIFFMVKQYPGAHVWIEGVAYQRTLEYWINEKMRKDLTFFNVDLLERKQIQSKEDRIEGLIPLYKNAMIFHRDSGEDKDYEEELLSFPQGKRDDRIDAVSFCLDIVPNTAIIETPEQKAERRREETENFDPRSPFSRV